MFSQKTSKTIMVKTKQVSFKVFFSQSISQKTKLDQ